MNDTFTQRVRAAAVAGWWTVLIGAIWLTIAWLVNLALLAARPDWLITLWGGEMTWNEVQSIMIRFIAVAKLGLLAGLCGTVWLTFWAYKLKKIAGP